MRRQLSRIKARARGFAKRQSHWFLGIHHAKKRADSLDSMFLWSECVTPIKIRESFGAQNESRIANMEIAERKFSQLSIAPGEVFDFWWQLGWPSPANGFQSGPSIQNGILLSDTGGGLCQVSSTLFNAFLLANLTIVERHAHSVDLHPHDRFIPLGQDAAVAYGYKNLIVVNPARVSLTLDLAVDREKLEFAVRIFGESPCLQDIKTTHEIESETADHIDLQSRRLVRENQTWIANLEYKDRYQKKQNGHG